MAKVRVCRADELPEGGAVRVEVGGTPVAVFNIEGRFYALADTCTHEESSLSEGYVEDDTVECPKHGAVFHIPTGEVRVLPATRPEPTFPVTVEDGDVYVEA